MSTADPELRERLSARPASIAPLRHAVVEFAAALGATDLQLDDIAVAVSEALNNVVKHAYVGDDSAGMMQVHARMAARSLIVTVSDAGRGLSGSDGRGIGMGLRLILQSTKRLQVGDVIRGARVQMTFEIG